MMLKWLEKPNKTQIDWNFWKNYNIKIELLENYCKYFQLSRKFDKNIIDKYDEIKI